MTALGNINAGSRITAADLRGVAPLEVIKQADQSLPSSTVLQNDTALVLAVLAGAQYDFECYLDYEGGTQGSSDIKWTWTVPSSATLRYGCTRVDTSGNVSVGTTQLGSDVQTARTNGAGNLLRVSMDGTLIVAGTAGNLQLQWAQNSSNATATIVHAQSKLKLTRIT